MQSQGELDLQRAGRALPLGAEQPAHPLQTLRDRVDMDVQLVLGTRRAHPAGEVRVEGAQEIRAALLVVGDDLADGALDEARDVPAPGQQQPQEPEVLGRGPVSRAAEEPQRVETPLPLGVGLGHTLRPYGEFPYGCGGADGDRLVDGRAQVSRRAAGQVRRGVAGSQGQQQDGAAVAGRGESVPGGGEVGRRGPEPAPGARFLVGVRCRAVQAGGEHHVDGIQVGVEAGRALAQQPGIAVAGVEQIVQQLAADALFGLGGRAPGEQQERGDHGGPLQGALVDGVEPRLAAKHQCAEQLAAGGDGRDPVVPVPDGVSFGA